MFCSFFIESCNKLVEQYKFGQRRLVKNISINILYGNYSIYITHVLAACFPSRALVKANSTTKMGHILAIT